MAKGTHKPPETKKVLQPVMQLRPRVLNGLSYDSGFQPKEGEYHLVEVDNAGNEVPNSDFSVHPRTFDRAYANNVNFKVKKKP